MNDYANALSDRVDYVLLIFAYLVHSTLYKLVSILYKLVSTQLINEQIIRHYINLFRHN